MIKSDWGTWLIDTIESSDPETLTAWYLGCNGIALKGTDGATVYIDPYLGLGDPPRTVRMLPVPFDPETPSMADAILVTHEHTDHLHGPTIGPMLESTGATLFAPQTCIDLTRDRGWTDTYDISDEQFVPIRPGYRTDIGELQLAVFDCHDPDADESVTYVLSDGKHTVVHCADGRPSDVLERIGGQYEVDIAFAAFGSRGMIPDKKTREPTITTWYNDTNDIVTMGYQLRAAQLVPTHWDMWKGMTADPFSLIENRRSLPYPERITCIEIGDSVAPR